MPIEFHTKLQAIPGNHLGDLDKQAQKHGTKAKPDRFNNHSKDTTIVDTVGTFKPGIRTHLEKTMDTDLYYNLRANDLDIQDILSYGESRNNGKHQIFRDLVFVRRYTTFDRQNPQSHGSPFYGFFTLFWLSMAGMLLRAAAQNWRLYGSILGKKEVLTTMFSQDVFLLGITDGVLCGSTLFGLLLQKLIVKGRLRWDKSGILIQYIWQFLYFTSAISWTFYRHWPWTHTVFIFLHSMVFLMKQHSYASYNGYLSQLFRKRQLLVDKGQYLVKIRDGMNSSSKTKTQVYIPTLNSPPSSQSIISHTQLRQRQSASSKGSIDKDFKAGIQEIESVAETINSYHGINIEQVDEVLEIIFTEIRAMTQELKGKCSLTENYYPSNLNIGDFVMWTCFPTLVYELEYPRQERIDWWYVAEKGAATFGIIGMMMAISQTYIYPPVLETVRMKESGMTIDQRWAEFPWIMLDMMFPLLLEQLLTWYVIWECILNVLAELTRFADRGFYGDWWNSVSWDQYARDWNRPVHNFLLRHVYHSSISAFHLSKSGATFVTFFLSACAHEMLMFCLFKKVRGYLFWLQLFQIPLVAASKTKFLKGRNVLGNIVFWIGLFIGPSFISSLYLIV